LEKQNNTTEKLTDKAFSRLLITSVVAILAGVVCLCSTTFAWFTDSVPSSNNQINTAADCLLSVVVTKDGVEIATVDNEADVELEKGVEYLVTLSLPADTASGYCLIETGDATYRSEYILRHEDDVAHTLQFTFKVDSAQTVKLVTRWGIFNDDPDVADGKTLLIP
jgi:hypothetical protein